MYHLLGTKECSEREQNINSTEDVWKEISELINDVEISLFIMGRPHIIY